MPKDNKKDHELEWELYTTVLKRIKAKGKKRQEGARKKQSSGICRD